MLDGRILLAEYAPTAQRCGADVGGGQLEVRDLEGHADNEGQVGEVGVAGRVLLVEVHAAIGPAVGPAIDTSLDKAAESRRRVPRRIAPDVDEGGSACLFSDWYWSCSGGSPASGS
jgi:hypothetical protein